MTSAGRRIALLAAVLSPAPILFLVDTAIALDRGWRPISRLDQGLIAVAAALVLVPIAGAASPRIRSVLARAAFPLAALALGAAAALAVGEVALARIAAARPDDDFHRRPPGTHATFHPDPAILPGVDGPSRFTTNSRGIRGPELPARGDAWRILCVGGSTTECLYLDDEETWPRLLAVRLESARPDRTVWAGDVGVSGFTSEEHLRFVEGSPGLVGEMDCLILLVGLNDFARAMISVTLARPAEPAWRRSRVLSGLREGWHRRFHTYDHVVEDDRGDNYVRRRELRAGAPITDRMPDLERPLSAFRERIARLVARCREAGVRPILVTQPVALDAHLSPAHRKLLWMGALGDGTYLSVETLREGVDRFNAALAEVGRAEDVLVVDLASMSGVERFFYDDCHFNEAGAAEVARRIAEGIQSEE